MVQVLDTGVKQSEGLAESVEVEDEAGLELVVGIGEGVGVE